MALEATTNTWPVVEILRPFVAQIVVGNAMKTKAIAEAKVKTDKVDAEVLAQLLRCDYLPSVWQPDAPTQQLRGWITHRAALMTQRSRLKNHVQSQLGRLLLHPPCKMLWTKAGLAWLKAIELPPHERLMLDSELRQMAAVERERVLLDEHLASFARQDPRVQLLMTIPGVNFVVGLGILTALGDIRRFQDGNHAAAYLGLAPLTRQSGNRCYHGHITKIGNSQARGLLTQAAQHASRHAGPLGAFFRRLTKRKNRSVAITALARKLVTIAFLMLKNNGPYRYARPDLMREKFTKLNVWQPDRSKKRAAKQPPPGLVEVYRAMGLPLSGSPSNFRPANDRCWQIANWSLSSKRCISRPSLPRKRLRPLPRSRSPPPERAADLRIFLTMLRRRAEQAARGLVRFGAPSIRLFLRLRSRRSRLRFTERLDCTPRSTPSMSMLDTSRGNSWQSEDSVRIRPLVGAVRIRLKANGASR